MSAAEKENIYIELRKYHLNEFPKELATSDMNLLRKSFQKLEDKMISMLLAFVNGRAAFVDMSDELGNFSSKIKSSTSTDRKEDIDRNFFTEKLTHLEQMLHIAEASSFKLKTPKTPRPIYGQARMKQS